MCNPEGKGNYYLGLRASGFRAYIYFAGPLLDSMEYTCECVPLAP